MSMGRNGGYETLMGPPGTTMEDIGLGNSEIEDARVAGTSLREKVLEDLKNRHVRIQDELDDLIKLLAFAKEALQTELVSGYGYQKKSITESDLRKLKDLSTVMANVVGVKMRYDKSAKELAEAMTPQEEKAAVLAYLKVMDRRELYNLFVALNEYLEKINIAPLRMTKE